jgi:O-glycosyl hydrolase
MANRFLLLIALIVLSTRPLQAATVSIDDSQGGRLQVIDGFGTCHGNPWAAQEWYQHLYFDDLGCSIERMGLTPHFISPYSDFSYVSPSYGNSPP